MEAVEAVEAKEVENVAEVKKSLITSIPSSFLFIEVKEKIQVQASEVFRVTYRAVNIGGREMLTKLISSSK